MGTRSPSPTVVTKVVGRRAAMASAACGGRNVEIPIPEEDL